MASVFNQRASLADFMRRPGEHIGKNIPHCSKAREVIAISVPVDGEVLDPTDARLADINQDTARGKMHASLLKIFSMLVDNISKLSSVITSESKLTSVEARPITPGRLRVADFVDRFGKVMAFAVGESPLSKGDSAAIEEDMMDVDEESSTSAFDVYFQHMNRAAASEASAEAPPVAQLEPYTSSNFLEGLSPTDPTVEVYIEMVYGSSADQSGKDKAAAAAENHMNANTVHLAQYAMEVERHYETNADHAIPDLEAELDVERTVLSSAKELVEERKIDSEDIPAGLGKRDDERLQCVTLWFLSNTLISSWSMLRRMVDASVSDLDASTTSNTLYAVRKDYLAEVTSASRPEGAEEDAQSNSISAMLLACGQEQAAFEETAAPAASRAGASRSNGPAPRKKSDRVAPGAQGNVCITVPVLNALTNDYAVGDDDRSSKAQLFQAGSGLMSRETNGDLDPSIMFSALDAVEHHGDNCHPEQSISRFMETDGGTYFVGGIMERDPEGFLYFHLPVPELATRISPTDLGSDYLIHCDLPKSTGELAPVLGTCHDLVPHQTLASIHMPGVIPSSAHSKATRRFMNDMNGRSSMSSVIEADPAAASTAHSDERAARLKYDMKSRIYAAAGVARAPRASPDTAEPVKDASKSVLTFDPRVLMEHSALLQIDPDIQIQGTRIRKCVDAVSALAQSSDCTPNRKSMLVASVRNWASERIFECASSKRNNSPSMRAIYDRASVMARTGASTSKPFTDDLPPISDFLARQTTAVADYFSSTEAYKTVMFWVMLQACFRCDGVKSRRQNPHAVGPGGGGKGVIARVIKELCNAFTDGDNNHNSTIEFVDHFSEKAFQSAEDPFGHNNQIIIIEETPQGKMKNKDEGGGANALLKNLLTSIRTNVRILMNDPATGTRRVIIVKNWVNIAFFLMSNAKRTHDLEKAFTDRAITIIMGDKGGTHNDISRAMAEDSFKSADPVTEEKREDIRLKFKELQAANALLENQLAFGGLTPTDDAATMGMLTSIFSIMSRDSAFFVDGRMLENICAMARMLCLAEFWVAEFTLPTGQFYGLPITANRLRAAEWALTIKMHHTVTALGFYAPLMFPQGQEAFRVGVMALLQRTISNVCSNNNIDRPDDRAMQAAEANAASGEGDAASDDFVDDADLTGITRVIAAICQPRHLMFDQARAAKTREEIERAFELEYVIMPDATFESEIMAILKSKGGLEVRPSINAIRDLRHNLCSEMLKAKPRRLGTSAFEPIVEATNRASMELPIIKTADRGRYVCVLRAFLDQNSTGIRALERAMKIALNNAVTPPASYLFTPGIGSTFNTIVLGRGLGPDSVTMDDIDIRVDAAGAPIGPVSAAAHRFPIIPNYLQKVAPADVTRPITHSVSREERQRLAAWVNITVAAENNADVPQAETAAKPQAAAKPNDIASAAAEVSNRAKPSPSNEDSLRQSSRWMNPDVATRAASAMLLCVSWDELARIRRAKRAHINVPRAPLYEERIATSMAHDWLSPDASISERDSALSEKIWGYMDSIVNRASPAGGSARVDNTALVLNAIDQNHLDELMHSLDGYEEEEGKKSVAEKEKRSASEAKKKKRNDLAAIAEKVDRPAAAARRPAGPHYAEPLPKAFSRTHIAIVHPADGLRDSRIDKRHLMVASNPCWRSDIASSGVYNPVGEVPLWSLIPGCNSFEQYFASIYSTPKDYHYRRLASDPAFGLRAAYPKSVVDSYDSRAAASSAAVTSGSIYVVRGESNRGLKRSASTMEAGSSASFANVLSKVGRSSASAMDAGSSASANGLSEKAKKRARILERCASANV